MYFYFILLLLLSFYFFFFFNDTATTEIYTFSLHDALPITAVIRAPCACGCPAGHGESPASPDERHAPRGGTAPPRRPAHRTPPPRALPRARSPAVLHQGLGVVDDRCGRCCHVPRQPDAYL